MKMKEGTRFWLLIGFTIVGISLLFGAGAGWLYVAMTGTSHEGLIAFTVVSAAWASVCFVLAARWRYF